MSYSTYLIRIADLHFWHYQLKAWQNHSVHGTLEQESRQSKGKHQESNPETDSLPQCQVCAALSLAYHTLRVTWAAKCADLPGNWKNSRLAPRDALCNKAGKGVRDNCRKLFLGQSWRKNWACPMPDDIGMSSTWQRPWAMISKAITTSVAQQYLFFS